MVTRRQATRSTHYYDDNGDENDDILETEGLLLQRPSRNGTTTTTTTTSPRRTYSDDHNGNDVVVIGRSNSSSNGRPRIPSSDSTEIAPLNLDHLTNRKVQVVSTPTKSSSATAAASSSSASSSLSNNNHKVKKFYKTYYGRTVSLSEYCRSHLSMICYYYPFTCKVMVLLTLLITMIFLASLMFNPVQEYGIIHYDHSNIHSIYDVQMGGIDHWCLGGGDSNCICDDPTTPKDRAEYKSWIEAFKSNRKLVKRFADKIEGSNLDIAFVGESIVEEIDGRWMGIRNRSDGLSRLENIFNQHFRKKLTGGNATYEGVALGIAGDTSPNVLYRLLHGEMPDYFQPKVWWLSLGNNDLGRTGCSEEIVVIGILRVVEEILNQRPQARVVINSLFPMTTTRGGRYPVISDYEDSFIRLGNHHHHHHHHRRLLLPLSKRSKRTKQTLLPSKVDLTDDNDMSAAAEQEEVLRDQEAQHKRQHRHRSEPNPIMWDGVTKTHKYKVGSILQPTEKPLWTSIRAINKQLKKFADKNERVLFFDATEIFATKLSSNKYQLLTDRISDRGHPTEEGFRIWEDEIAKKLEQILSTMRQEYPDLFKPVPSWYGGYDTTSNTNNINIVGKGETATTPHTVDDDVVSRLDDDLDEKTFFVVDDFTKKQDHGNDKIDEDKNILIDPDESNNDDDDVTEGDLIVAPPTKKSKNSKNTDDDDDSSDDRAV